jgi:hypothetical protein
VTQFDLHEIARIVTLAGVKASVGSAGDTDCIFVGDVDDTEGTPRYTVVAGPGWPSRTDGVSYGTAGEFSFNQDSDDEGPAYTVRHWETPAGIAARIVRLHKAVDARRTERRRLTGELEQLPAVLEALAGEDLGGPTPTKVTERPGGDMLTDAPGDLTMATTRDTAMFAELLRWHFGQLLEEGPVYDVTVFTARRGLGPMTACFFGEVVQVGEQVLKFADGVTVDVGMIRAVKH